MRGFEQVRSTSQAMKMARAKVQRETLSDPKVQAICGALQKPIMPHGLGLL